MSRKQKSTGFTLVELLVVISIIALLIAILLPALAAARDAARAIQCGSNIRQVDMGIHLYANDHDGYPPRRANRKTYATSGSNPFYYGYGGILRHYNYVSSSKVFICPNATVTNHWPITNSGWQDKDSAYWWYMSYGANTKVMEKGRYNSHDSSSANNRISAFKSNMIIIGEAVSSYVDTNPYEDGWYALHAAKTEDTVRLAPRHNDNSTANVAFIDGHVKLFKAKNLGFNPGSNQWMDTFDFNNSPWHK